VWVAKTWEAFHRLCTLDHPQHRFPDAAEIFAAMLAAPGFSFIVQRVRILRLEVPKPNLGIDYDWSLSPSPPSRKSSLGSSPVAPTASYCDPSSPPPSSGLSVETLPSPPSSDSSASPSPPLPVAHNTGACPPSCHGCLHPLDLPSSVPSAFCRRNGTRLPGFGKGRDGTQVKTAVWNCIIPVMAQAPDRDLAWLLHNEWAPLHIACRQYGSSPQEDPRPPSCVRRLIDANGGLALLHRICRVPVPGPQAPLLRPLSSPNDGRASSSGSVDTGGGGSPPCSPGSSGPSDNNNTSSPCGSDAHSSSGGSLPSDSPTTLRRPDRVLPLTTAVAATTAGAPTAASSSHVPNTAPSASPDQYSHPPSPPVVPCGVALHAGHT